jgi:hypothetical protein
MKASTSLTGFQGFSHTLQATNNKTRYYIQVLSFLIQSISNMGRLRDSHLFLLPTNSPSAHHYVWSAHSVNVVTDCRATSRQWALEASLLSPDPAPRHCSAWYPPFGIPYVHMCIICIRRSLLVPAAAAAAEALSWYYHLPPVALTVRCLGVNLCKARQGEGALLCSEISFLSGVGE